MKPEVIIEKVKELGKYQVEHFRKNDIKIDSKSNKTDLVTEVDKTSEKELISFIKENFPNHSVLAEEGGSFNKESEYRWIIDPLDGTNNYANGLPHFCISVALEKDGEEVFGVVYAPYLNEMFTTRKGKGAYLNGKKLQVSNKTKVDGAMLVTGFPYDKKTAKYNNVAYAKKMIPNLMGFRRTGSAALDLAYVAGGFFDGYWEMNLNRWDVAAGTLLVKEAGGEVVNFREDRNISLIAGNLKICKDIQRIIDEVNRNY